jgi:hypothetical protein
VLHPVLRHILGQGEIVEPGSVDAIVYITEYAETRFGEKGMSQFGVNVEAKNMLGIWVARGGQIVFHREMQELYYFSAAPAVDGPWTPRG